MERKPTNDKKYILDTLSIRGWTDVVVVLTNITTRVENRNHKMHERWSEISGRQRSTKKIIIFETEPIKRLRKDQFIKDQGHIFKSSFQFYLNHLHSRFHEFLQRLGKEGMMYWTN